MCFVYSKNANLMQTLIGLCCYVGGLKEKFIQLFHMFGLSLTPSSIRNLGEYWSKTRNILAEINPAMFWKYSYDNLDFCGDLQKLFIITVLLLRVEC